VVTGQRNHARQGLLRPVIGGDRDDGLHPPVDLEGVEGQIAGVVADTAVDQRLLDRLVGRGVEFIAARDFAGVIKRPLSVRLMKLP
jgi:hypothetical protein